ncbi:hypothetical protein GCM10027087_29040 [Paractinoplanes abujensis]
MSCTSPPPDKGIECHLDHHEIKTRRAQAPNTARSATGLTTTLRWLREHPATVEHMPRMQQRRVAARGVVADGAAGACCAAAPGMWAELEPLQVRSAPGFRKT